MSYRTFHQEKYYDAPDFQGLPQTLHALGTLAMLKAQRQRQAQDLQANYQIGVEKGYFPQIQKQLSEGAMHLTQKLTEHFANGGQYVPAEIKNGQAYLSSTGKLMESLKGQADAIQQQIALKKSDDPYYNDSEDEQNLKYAYHPSLDTPEKIQNHLNSIRVGENPAAYDRGKITADHVKEQGLKTKENSNEDISGLKKSSFQSGRFLLRNGQPGINDEHVADYFKKHPSLYHSFANETQDDIAQEIQAARANDEEWTRGKTDEQLFSDISQAIPGVPHKMVPVTDANDNPVLENGKPVMRPMEFGDRVKEKAKAELKQYEDTHSKFSIDRKDYQPGSQYGITSKQYNAPADGFNQGYLSGPSRMLVKKSGVGDNRMLYIPGSSAEWRYDHDTNAYVQTSKNSAVPFVMTSYQWGPVDAQGKPISLNATSTSDMLTKLKELPDDAFGPGSIAGVKPIISGKAIDKAAVLNLAYNGGKLNELKERARMNPDDKNLQQEASGLEEALDNMQADRAFDSQLIQKLMGTDIVKNQSFVANPGDTNVQSIQADTGMNIYDPKSMSPDMKTVTNYINGRIKEAAAKKSEPKAAPIESKPVDIKANEVEQNGNIFVKDPATGKFKFSRKK